MYERHLERRLRTALSDTPAVFLGGPRQAGKSTLAGRLDEGEASRRRYLTFDDAATLAAASADPQGFVDQLDGPAVLDEVQRVPAIFLALKRAIDRDRRPGRFLLTGAANPLVAPALAESLAGRLEILTLWPLSQGEILDVHEGFVDGLLGELSMRLPDARPEGRVQVLAQALRGGYPEVVDRSDPERRRDWLAAYASALLLRDVRDVAQVESLTAFPRLLALIATRAGGALNAADLGRAAAVPYATLRRYLALLEALHLILPVPAWSSNASSRLVKAPRLLVTDPGLLAHLAGWSLERLDQQPGFAGPLLESFVGMELVKQLGWARTRATLHWYRAHGGREVDYVLEGDDGRLVGIEVKASVGLSDSDFAGLRELAALAGRRFHRGVVLYTGQEVLPFGERLLAAPISTLWGRGGAAEKRASEPPLRVVRKPRTG